MRTRRHKFNLIVAAVVGFGGLAAVIATDTRPRLGLDLEGGVSVILTARAEGAPREDVMQKTVEIIRQRIDELGVAEAEVTIGGTDNILIQLPGVEDEQEALETIGSTAQLTFRQVKRIIPPTAPERRRPPVTEERGPEVSDEEVVYPGADEDASTLYVLEPARLTGDVVERAEAVPDPVTAGSWSVSIEMSGEGAEEWAAFTSELACLRDEGERIKSQVAIVLDGRVESAAGMQDPATSATGGVECGRGIPDGQTQIDTASRGEARALALVLRTGALPLTLEQSEVQKISPSLGRDSLDAGLRAGFIGLALVMLYVLIYYRALGLVIWVGLALFAATNYTIVSLLGAEAGLALSLAGIAGFIISVGVTADSYIVAFERLKDEVRAGKSVRAAVDRGMTRAFRTILIADFVTASAAIILFLLAVGPVRGFALTLGLATLVDVLIFYFYTRPAVTLLSRSKTFGSGRVIGMRHALGAEA